MTAVVVELYDALRKAGVDETLARSAAAAVIPLQALEGLTTKHDLAESQAATKHDIAELRTATKHDIAELRTATKHDIAELSAATKNDIAALRLATKADISELRAELIKWNVGAMAMLTAIFAAIARLA